MLKLRRIMDEEKITSRFLADLLGCSEKTVNNKIGGKFEFTYAEVKKIKGLFPKYDLEYLLSDEA